jgi:hypothetical protein
MSNTDATAPVSHSDREAWLNAAVEVFRPRFVEIGFPVPDKLRVAVGFGPRGARSENKIILGVCLHSSRSADNVNEIWISPEDADTVSMLSTLIHELIHAALNLEDGHKGKFAEAATRLGLEGKMTESAPGLGLLVELITIAETLGDYPGARVDVTYVDSKRLPVGPDGTPVPRTSSGPREQKNRQLLLICEEGAANKCECGGYKVRTSAKWIAIGLPSCPMGTQMTAQ